jgi:phage shock protein PspC (stress-responsive transcriptional regulator)
MDNLLTRDDTFLGVCEGLGEDLRIPPTLLRLGFAGLLFWNPVASIVLYLALGALVALIRWLAPDPRVAAAPEAGAEAEAEAETAAEPCEEPLPIAA